MDIQLRARCDRQIDNEKALRNMSAHDSEAAIKVGSLLYTALDLPVSDDKVYASKQLLESKDGIFSNFRGVLQTLLIIRMSVSKDPESYLNTIIDIYNRLEKDTGISGLFTVITAVITAEGLKNTDSDDAVGQIVNLFTLIRNHHPEWVTSSELAYAALMYFSGKADPGLEDEKERIYTALREKLNLSDDTAKAAALVLMANSKSATVKVDQFAGFYNQLAASGHATGKNQYMSIYGAFADLTYLEKLGIPESETINAIGEVEDYLKKKPGYGMFSINKDMRKVLAAALTLQHYTIEIPREKHSDFNPEISIELLLFIVLMSLVTLN